MPELLPTNEYRYRRLQLEVEDRANRRDLSTVVPTGATGLASAAEWSLRGDACATDCHRLTTCRTELVLLT